MSSWTWFLSPCPFPVYHSPSFTLYCILYCAVLWWVGLGWLMLLRAGQGWMGLSWPLLSYWCVVLSYFVLRCAVLDVDGLVGLRFTMFVCLLIVVLWCIRLVVWCYVVIVVLLCWLGLGLAWLFYVRSRCLLLNCIVLGWSRLQHVVWYRVANVGLYSVVWGWVLFYCVMLRCVVLCFVWLGLGHIGCVVLGSIRMWYVVWRCDCFVLLRRVRLICVGLGRVGLCCVVLRWAVWCFGGSSVISNVRT